ncbi:universal stress protein [Novosphingobium pentaromativorans]|uniref:UspA n=1 Tax=Novosphingobium pentaromativorans US6-1 TaxID=1088721 RepID=G6E6W2_9SPHN|nr:universal stress protein [Novosphingobium pentaromativorans]AIT78396.1 universal stress protein UspA [Novosphingobium pentaromativorans US6-1]EHJ63008.1 UspA [Novosphingobium pentaromativorans US6-1]
MASMAKSILVATDLSARSDRAVDRATMLAKQWDTRLIVIHVLEHGSKLESDSKAAEQVIRTVLPNPLADVDIVPGNGSAPSTIVQTAASLDCGLIVMGVARFNHLGDHFIGTAVDHVVRHATAPVLVVKQRPHGPYTTILVATDHSSCSRHALLTAARLFPDAAIHLVNAYHVPYEGWLRSQEVKDEVTREAQAELDAFVQDAAIPESLRVRLSSSIGYGETHTVVWNEVEKVGADLVVLGTHGRTGFVPAVIGSMAESLLRCVPCDTLMVREPS